MIWGWNWFPQCGYLFSKPLCVYTPLVCPLLCKINLKILYRHWNYICNFINQIVQWAQHFGGQRRFLNNLDLKQPDAALSPHHRFSHGSRSPTFIHNPQRGFPHPLTPSLLNACRTRKPKQITWGGGVYMFVWEEVVVGGWDFDWDTLFPIFKQNCSHFSCGPCF